MSLQPFAPAGPASVPANLSNLLMPAGALAETFPRIQAQASMGLTSTQTNVSAIPLPAGLKVSNIGVITSNTAETGGSHGWHALLDPTGKVLAVSADQTGATVWSPSSSEILIPMITPYVTPAAGTYYLACCITATQTPTLAQISSGGGAYATSQAPILGGNGGIQSTPPAVGTVLSLTATTNFIYGYVS